MIDPMSCEELRVRDVRTSKRGKLQRKAPMNAPGIALHREFQ